MDLWECRGPSETYFSFLKHNVFVEPFNKIESRYLRVHCATHGTFRHNQVTMQERLAKNPVTAR